MTEKEYEGKRKRVYEGFYFLAESVLEGRIGNYSWHSEEQKQKDKIEALEWFLNKSHEELEALREEFYK